jgi:hypothetical protein
VEVNVIDDDEDIGVYITRMDEPTSSPDPLTLGTKSSKSSNFTNRHHLVVHPFDADDPMTSGPSHIEDSGAVQQLRQRNMERKRKPEINEVPDSESDGIEEFDDDVKADPSKRGQSSKKNVRTKIDLFEARGEKKVPHVDLASVNKARQNKSIAGSMKPRSVAPKPTEKSGLVKFNIAISS